MEDIMRVSIHQLLFIHNLIMIIIGFEPFNDTDELPSQLSVSSLETKTYPA